jgi:nucleoside phosphorylase
MLLTLRFAALQKDDGVLHDDIKSDSVDIDDGNSASRGNDLGRLSDIDSQADVSMKDMDGEDNGGDAMDLDDDVVEDVIPIPDTDLDLEDVPRQCDGLAAENDAFLKKVIESGAYQSWREEPARKGPSLSHNDYMIGWICALPVETTAAALMLDKIHPPLPPLPMDKNAYTFGSIGEHNIVIASLPAGAFGNTSAATVGMQLLSSFHAIRFGFIVGIGGGVPSSKADIRLGDIVVSQPTDTSGGVIQYDLGKALSGGQFTRTGMLNRPPKVLLTALATLQAHHLMEDSRVVEFVSNLQDKMAPHNATRFTRPTQEDCLFQAEYDHVASDTCIKCDRSKVVLRPLREHQEPVIHYGLIGSANQAMTDSRRRDQLARDLGVYCVEMEAAGLMNDFPCLVIRGICDYADSHKNKEWQGYAATVAAAYAKELLLVVPVDQVQSAPIARDTLAEYGERQEMKSIKSLTTKEEHSTLTFNSSGGPQTNNVNSGIGQQINNNAHIGTQYIQSGKEQVPSSTSYQ